MKIPTLSTPSWKQKIHWILNPVSYMENNAKSYPDIFDADVVGFDNSLIYVNHPQGIQQLLSNDSKIFSTPGDFNRILQPIVGDYSILLLENDKHKKRRKLLIPPFHGNRMVNYGELILKLCHQIFAKLPQDKPFVARQLMQEISLQVILQAVYGVYEGDNYEQLKSLIGSMTDLFRSTLTSTFLFFKFLQQDLGPWSPWGNFIRNREAIDILIYKEIAQRHQQSHEESQDILSLLMSARDEDGNPMTEQELRDELMTLMFAGHETTATAMSWALYWIYKLPEVRTKLLQELDSLGESPDPMAISRLPYLTAVCQETLRIYPVGMLTFPRLVKEPVELLGYELEPDNIVVGCIYLVHQREDLYPQPKQFKPERFLEKQYSPYEFIPFGGGSRRCIGDALALFEMKLAIATIVSNYDLELADSRPEKPKRRGVTLAPERGVKMLFKGHRLKSTAERQKEALTTK